MSVRKHSFWIGLCFLVLIWMFYTHRFDPSEHPIKLRDDPSLTWTPEEIDQLTKTADEYQKLKEPTKSIYALLYSSYQAIGELTLFLYNVNSSNAAILISILCLLLFSSFRWTKKQKLNFHLYTVPKYYILLLSILFIWGVLSILGVTSFLIQFAGLYKKNMAPYISYGIEPPYKFPYAAFFLKAYPAALLSFFTSLHMYRKLRLSLLPDYHKYKVELKTYTDQQRHAFLNSHRQDILSQEDKIIYDYDVRMSEFREMIFAIIFNLTYAELDDLKRYYSEPKLLLDLAKTTPEGGEPMPIGYDDKSPAPPDPEKQVPAVPDKFDLETIKTHLLQVRFDRSVASTYAVNLLKRFKSKQYRKNLEEVMKYLDLQIEYQGKIYAARDKDNALKLQDIYHQLEKEKIKTQIMEEQKKQTDLSKPQPQPPPPESHEDKLKKLEEEANFEAKKEVMWAKIKSERDQKIRRIHIDAFDKIVETCKSDLQKIENDPSLSDDLKKEAVRSRQQMAIKELEQLERDLLSE